MLVERFGHCFRSLAAWMFPVSVFEIKVIKQVGCGLIHDAVSCSKGGKEDACLLACFGFRQGRRYPRFALTPGLDATSSHRLSRPAGSARRYLLVASFSASHAASSFSQLIAFVLSTAIHLRPSL